MRAAPVPGGAGRVLALTDVAPGSSEALDPISRQWIPPQRLAPYRPITEAISWWDILKAAWWQGI